MAATMENPNPERPRCRRFGIGDSMILIAALAVAITLSRGAILNTRQSFFTLISSPIKPPPPEPYRTYIWIERDAALRALPTGLFSIGLFTICTAIIAHILIRLRRPRPPLPQLFFQPGFAATTSIVLAISYCVYLRYMDYVLSVNRLLVYFCSIVPVVWLILRLSGRWEAESGWIDRFGTALGWAWIVGSLPVIWFIWFIH